MLGDRRQFLCGDQLTCTDVRLFVCLIRFDEVYSVLFKCDKRLISDYKYIMMYMKRLWEIDAFKDTTKMDHIKVHYFTSFPALNKFGIIPSGPKFIEKLN